MAGCCCDLIWRNSSSGSFNSLPLGTNCGPKFKRVRPSVIDQRCRSLPCLLATLSSTSRAFFSSKVSITNSGIRESNSSFISLTSCTLVSFAARGIIDDQSECREHYNLAIALRKLDLSHFRISV